MASKMPALSAVPSCKAWGLKRAALVDVGEHLLDGLVQLRQAVEDAVAQPARARSRGACPAKQGRSAKADAAASRRHEHRTQNTGLRLHLGCGRNRRSLRRSRYAECIPDEDKCFDILRCCTPLPYWVGRSISPFPRLGEAGVRRELCDVKLAYPDRPNLLLKLKA